LNSEAIKGLSPSITPFGKRKFCCWINHTGTVFFVNSKNEIVKTIFSLSTAAKCGQFKDIDLLISIRNVALKGKNRKTTFQEGVDASLRALMGAK
jgi:hypothetical protein